MREDVLKSVDPEILEAIKQQVIADLDDRDAREKEKNRIQIEEDLKVREEYLERMKKSPKPWVELVGMSQVGGNIKIELDWNDAFVTELRKNGFTGPDDETVVQRYIAVLARDVAEDMAGSDGGE